MLQQNSIEEYKCLNYHSGKTYSFQIIHLHEQHGINKMCYTTASSFDYSVLLKEGNS